MRKIFMLVTVLMVAAALRPIERACAASRQPLAVIAHPGLQINVVHVSALRAVFLRQTEQLGGERVVPINAPAGQPLRLDFDARVLGMSQEEAGRYWVDARIRGFGAPPRTIAVPQLVIRSVAVLPGAISYVPKASLTGITVKVKVLSVAGLDQPL